MKLHPQIREDQLTDLFEFINSPEELKEQLGNLSISIDSPMLSRVNKWFYFLNKNYAQAPCMFTHTVYAIIKAAMSNEVFRSQTTHEFETSLRFYEIAIKSEVFIDFEEIDSADMFLSISLLYGKYPGMVLTSTYKSLTTLEERSGIEELKALYKSLFVKYEDPYVLSNNLFQLSLTETEAMMHVLRGLNIRAFSQLPVPISKKASFYLMNHLPDNLRFDNNVLVRSIICSKLLLAQFANKHLLQPFLSASTVFELKVFTFYDDLPFWTKAFELMCGAEGEELGLSAQEFVDYFEYKKYTEDQHYSLKGRTTASIAQAIYNWHEAADFEKTKGFIDMKWEGSKIQEWTAEEQGDKYFFQEITDGNELLRESETMKHCVFSYIESCVAGYSAIWSMKKEVNSIYQGHATIEIRDKRITQVAGKRNKTVSRSDIGIIKRWASEMEFTCEYWI